MNLTEQKVAAGSILIWQPMECRRSDLSVNLQQGGFTLKIPDREEASLLAGAMVSAAETVAPAAKNCVYYTKPRKKSVVIELYHLRKGDRDYPNEVTRIANGSQEEGRITITQESGFWHSDYDSQVRQGIADQKGLVPKDGVTAMMVSLLGSLNGYAFRGGAYYLPEQSRQRFEQFMDCLIGARVDDKTPLPCLLTQMGDERTLESIKNGALQALKDETSAIFEEIKTTAKAGIKMRSDGIESRKQALVAQRKRLAVYRDILGEAAQVAEEGIQKAEQALSIAIRQATT